MISPSPFRRVARLLIIISLHNLYHRSSKALGKEQSVLGTLLLPFNFSTVEVAAISQVASARVSNYFPHGHLLRRRFRMS